MGFIFGNHRSYSNLLELMSLVGATPVDTELSVSAQVNGQAWCTSGGACGAGTSGATVMHPEGAAECDRFHALAERYWENPAFNLMPLGLVLDMFGFTSEWRDIYLSPLLQILFLDTKASYNMSSRFMFNVFGGPNKFMDLKVAAKAFTVKGGTRDTWNRVVAKFPERVHVGRGVGRLHRRTNQSGEAEVELEFDDGKREVFEHVILACSGKAADLLLGPDKPTLERLVFEQIRYNSERCVLHRDVSFLPPNESGLTRNFNYYQDKTMENPTLSGSMLHVSQHPRAPDTFKRGTGVPVLTTAPCRPIAQEDVVQEWWGALHVQDIRHLVNTRVPCR